MTDRECDLLDKELIEQLEKNNIVREKIIKDYMEEHPGTVFVCFNTPTYIYDKEEKLKTFHSPQTDVDINGCRYMVDQLSEYFNISDYHRFTKHQPQNKKRRIFLLGGETVFGVGVDDEHTIASQLQKLFKHYLPDEDIVVENYGQYFGTDVTLKELESILVRLPVSPQGGDVILLNTEKTSKVPFIDMSKVSVLEHTTKLFFDKNHFTPYGNKLIADRLYRELIYQELLPIGCIQGIERYDNIPSIKESGLSVSGLRGEKDFRNYMKLLKSFADKYTICIVSYRTPCGEWFTKEDSKLLLDIGFKIDLYQKIKHSYLAVLDAGRVVTEIISDEPFQPVEATGVLSGNKFELRSSLYAEKGKRAKYIKWNGKYTDPIGHGSGLYFVIYDKANQLVLDAVNFDLKTKKFVCYRATDLNDWRKSWSKRNPNVVLATFNSISFPSKDLTENEKYILENNPDTRQLSTVLSNPNFALYNYYDKKDIEEVLNVPDSYHDSRGVRHFYDILGACINIVGGHRVTLFQPKKPKRTLYLVGGCTTFGTGCKDEHTLASNLQKIFNKYLPDERIIVQNYGYFLLEPENATEDERTKIIESLPVKDGDIILLDQYISSSVVHLRVQSVAQECRSVESFYERGHYTPDGQRLWAEKMYEGIIEYDLIGKAKERKMLPASQEATDYSLKEEDASELSLYKKSLCDLYVKWVAKKKERPYDEIVGSIVMNCNPFTLGHRYLVEKALEQCDYLVIFVVEEDKSIFPFQDRLRLVKEGTADLSNVLVVPSGRFIISALTFSEYFNKSKLQDMVVDTSMDLLLFSREIAPCLHIQKRFAGQEPIDAVTRQYNESMKKILPEYGIEFIEIARREVGKDVISASRVRTLLEKKKLDELKLLVPDTTFSYIVDKFL